MADFLIFDSEFTDNTGELLELSIFNIEGEEIYHSYFKPKKAKTWGLHPHNISPEMVADKPSFDKERAKLQKIFDGASYLVGFETTSDLDHLFEQGIKGLYHKKMIELRDLYWFARGNEDGLGLFSTPGLDKCIMVLGFSFDEHGAHSASGDTKATWELFMRLLGIVREKLGMDAESSPEEVWNEASKHILKEKERLAHGFVTLIKDGDAYRLAGSAHSPNLKHPSYVTHIEVNDWKRAICELEFMKYANYNRTYRMGFYRLNAKEIRQFQKYTNEYDPEKADEFRRMYNIRRRR